MQDSIEQKWQDSTEVYFLLATQEMIEVKKHPPEGFYVKGVVEGGQFVPKSSILGIGELAKEGRYGWLELNTKEFFPMESDRKATTPFVKGFQTEGGFIPSVRDVFNDR